MQRYSYPYTDLNRSLWIQEVQASRTSRQLAYKGDKFASCKQPAAFTIQEIYLVIIHFRGRKC